MAAKQRGEESVMRHIGGIEKRRAEMSASSKQCEGGEETTSAAYGYQYRQRSKYRQQRNGVMKNIYHKHQNGGEE